MLNATAYPTPPSPALEVGAQGTCMDRTGQVHASRDASKQVWVGGESTTCINGEVPL